MARFWEFFENLKEYVYVADTDTCELVYMNRYMREGYGKTTRDYAGKKCYEVLYKCTEPCTMCNRNKLQIGKFDEWQSYDNKLGLNFFIKDSVIEEDGHRYRIEFAEAVDLQDREERQAQEYLDMVNDIIHSGLWYMNFDRDGTMTQVVWSQKFREMLGYTDTNDFPDVLESWSDRLHPKDKAATMAAYWDAVAGGREYNVKYRLKKKDGEYDWFHTRGHVQTYEDGTARLFLGIFINITKDVQTEQALEEAYQAANHANAAKTVFMANMSHDIRTPLNAIVGMTAIAAAHIDEPKQIEHCLAEITASSKHLLSLVNEVLDMNRIESGQLSLNIASICLPELVDDFLTMAKPLANGKNQDISVLVQNIRHENVYGDAERIKQCLMNFMSNAVKYTPEGGKIIVTVSEKATNRPERSCFEFIFEDNGIGMSKEFIQRIFEPFTRAEDEKAFSQQGAGLGMAISKSIIQMMNGNIKVESELNKGSKFTVTIFLEIQDEAEMQLEEYLPDQPALVVDDEQNSQEPEEEPQNALSQYQEADFSGKRGLLVEDNKINAEIAIAILSMTGMEVDHVWNGKEAVDRLNCTDDGVYDIVFMDIQMPVMDGYEATMAIRTSEREYLKNIPIIALSANAFAEDVQRSREAGMNQHISKPLDLNQLLTTMVSLFADE